MQYVAARLTYASTAVRNGALSASEPNRAASVAAATAAAEAYARSGFGTLVALALALTALTDGGTDNDAPAAVCVADEAAAAVTGVGGTVLTAAEKKRPTSCACVAPKTANASALPPPLAIPLPFGNAVWLAVPRKPCPFTTGDGSGSVDALTKDRSTRPGVWHASK